MENKLFIIWLGNRNMREQRVVKFRKNFMKLVCTFAIFKTFLSKKLRLTLLHQGVFRIDIKCLARNVHEKILTLVFHCLKFECTDHFLKKMLLNRKPANQHCSALIRNFKRIRFPSQEHCINLKICYLDMFSKGLFFHI